MGLVQVSHHPAIPRRTFVQAPDERHPTFSALRTTGRIHSAFGAPDTTWSLQSLMGLRAHDFLHFRLAKLRPLRSEWPPLRPLLRQLRSCGDGGAWQQIEATRRSGGDMRCFPPVSGFACPPPQEYNCRGETAVPSKRNCRFQAMHRILYRAPSSSRQFFPAYSLVLIAMRVA